MQRSVRLLNRLTVPVSEYIPDFRKKIQCVLHLLPGNPDPCNLFTIVTLSYCCFHHACQFMVVISLNTPQLCEYVLAGHCQNTGSVNQIKI